MIPTALGEKFCMEYRKAQYWNLCFSILLYMFYFLEDYEIANYTDDTTPCSVQRNHQFVIKEELENSSAILFFSAIQFP